MLAGKSNANGLSVLRPEYMILFKAEAYLDLKKRKENGEDVDSNDIKKYKKGRKVFCRFDVGRSILYV